MFPSTTPRDERALGVREVGCASEFNSRPHPSRAQARHREDVATTVDGDRFPITNDGPHRPGPPTRYLWLRQRLDPGVSARPGGSAPVGGGPPAGNGSSATQVAGSVRGSKPPNRCRVRHRTVGASLPVSNRTRSSGRLPARRERWRKPAITVPRADAAWGKPRVTPGIQPDWGTLTPPGRE